MHIIFQDRRSSAGGMLMPVLLLSLFSLFCPVNNLFIRFFHNYLFICLLFSVFLIGNTRCSSCSKIAYSPLAPFSLSLSLHPGTGSTNIIIMNNINDNSIT